MSKFAFRDNILDLEGIVPLFQNKIHILINFLLMIYVGKIHSPKINRYFAGLDQEGTRQAAAANR
jgi:hypothetical protein